jgi:Na+-transporting NADH:ubiquinone oxidoreductase subunit A
MLLVVTRDRFRAGGNKMLTIRKGLDVPISGAPEPNIGPGPAVREVALLGSDYVGLKLTLLVREGEVVKRGQALFEDKRNPGVYYTSPAGGTVAAIHRGEKRRFRSLVIEVADEEPEQQFKERDVVHLTSEQVRADLLSSGLWAALRTRPYSKIPAPRSEPHSIFVTAIDTEPLAADPAPIIAEQHDDFVFGLHALKRLTSGPVYVCHRHGSEVPGQDVPGVSMQAFEGPHPAGLPGTHIHFLDPVSARKSVWYLNYQDAIAFGTLFRTGRLNVERVISLAGPAVKRPRLIRTRLGACVDELVKGELEEGVHRVISGSVLTGRKSEPPVNYLGRYHLQISAVPEATRREFLGWQTPGFDRFSATRTFAQAWTGSTRPLTFTTTLSGSRRAMVPIGVYERVMPLDLLPTQLLRALIVGDTDQAQALGCLELDEEDLALCTFVCPSKYEYGPLLRENLNKIEIEG